MKASGVRVGVFTRFSKGYEASSTFWFPAAFLLKILKNTYLEIIIMISSDAIDKSCLVVSDTPVYDNCIATQTFLAKIWDCHSTRQRHKAATTLHELFHKERLL